MTEQLIEVVAGLVSRHKADGRAVYDKAAKAELVRRCRQPGVSVARMALAHGLNANVLRKWMKQMPVLQASSGVALVAVRTVSTPPSLPDTGYLELIVAGGTIRAHGQVSTTMLERALQCLRHP